jgi:inosine/xanthosine triphosphatase
MIVNVGSQNPTKVQATRRAFLDYPQFQGVVVYGKDVESGVTDQPTSIDETLSGARNRAVNSFTDNCDYSIGLESGIMPISYLINLDFTACAVYNGRKIFLGFSPAIQFPPEVNRLILDENHDVNEAFFKAGYTNNPKLGDGRGAIGLLTKDVMTREDYTKHAITVALAGVLNQDWYKT